jgi:hypothetical protein
MRPNQLSAPDLAGWYRSTGKVSKATVSIDALAGYFIDEGADEGVSGDVAFAQSMVETGYLTFPSGGQVKATDNNFAGLGAVDGGSNPAKFPDARTGVRAQVQHLRAYGDPTVTEAKLHHPLVDPRFNLVTPKGKAPTWDQFGNGIWASAPNYATAVLAMYGKIQAWAAEHHAWEPFADVDSLVRQGFRDLLFREATAAELKGWHQSLVGGHSTPEVFLGSLMAGEGTKDQQPVARLYQAAFGRLPDRGGLSYWSRKHKAGTSLLRIAGPFVASPEFQHRFGSPPNRAFVELLYDHVLGRPGDSGGIDYWTHRLDTGAQTRAAVVVQFAQSSEFIRRSGPTVEAAQGYLGMLLRRPTADEITAWAAQRVDGHTLAALGDLLLHDPAYAARFS